MDYSEANYGSLIFEEVDHSLFQLISASLVVDGNTQIQNQSSVINAFLSTVTFADSTLSDLTFMKTSIQVVSSEASFTNMTIQRLDNPSQTGFILAMMESTLTIKDLAYSGSNSILFKVRTSSVSVSGVTFHNIANSTKLIEVSSSYNVSVSNITSSNSVITGPQLISVSQSLNVSLNMIHIQNSEKNAIYIKDSSVTEMSEIVIENSLEALTVEGSTVSEFRNSSFIKNGGTTTLTGGSLKVIDSIVSMANNTFLSNTAHSGGAIFFTCSSLAN